MPKLVSFMIITKFTFNWQNKMFILEDISSGILSDLHSYSYVTNSGVDVLMPAGYAVCDGNMSSIFKLHCFFLTNKLEK